MQGNYYYFMRQKQKTMHSKCDAEMQVISDENASKNHN